MKCIVAIVRQEKFEDVKRALVEVGCDGMTVSEVKGRGSQKGVKESYRGSSYCIDLLPKTRVEIVVKDEKLDIFVEAIKKGAYTGNIGDGKIFIQPIENVIRIRTGEEGDKVV
ncbi:MAG: P-II family nitrogen regulator [Methanobrevibacter thaueri]|jgi:nitrogen regulatory protein P-II 1|uniref:P-II family nitrogen regulator n=1 Tax=Methanobrevibacter thaueri TaxID=190975 RepID=UPI0026F25B03|nr:P-II family nitrogen regulator [Methanobrevibacter thaueri]MBE6494926.1 P-II family nitrogen regulator [Methanobrevibacter thaueri]